MLKNRFERPALTARLTRALSGRPVVALIGPRTQAGAELDLLLMRRGRRIGVEVKYADAPAMTRSMHACIESLKLERLYVVYPGSEAYALRPGVEVLPLPLARERLAR